MMEFHRVDLNDPESDEYNPGGRDYEEY
jgi:hypothetical protein